MSAFLRRAGLRGAPWAWVLERGALGRLHVHATYPAVCFDHLRAHWNTGHLHLAYLNTIEDRRAWSTYLAKDFRQFPADGKRRYRTPPGYQPEMIELSSAAGEEAAVACSYFGQQPQLVLPREGAGSWTCQTLLFGDDVERVEILVECERCGLQMIPEES